jgi:hypothetical protein
LKLGHFQVNTLSHFSKGIHISQVPTLFMSGSKQGIVKGVKGGFTLAPGSLSSPEGG